MSCPSACCLRQPDSAGTSSQPTNRSRVRTCTTRKVLDKYLWLCYGPAHDEALPTTETFEDLGAHPGRPGLKCRQLTENPDAATAYRYRTVKNPDAIEPLGHYTYK